MIDDLRAALIGLSEGPILLDSRQGRLHSLIADIRRGADVSNARLLSTLKRSEVDKIPLRLRNGPTIIPGAKGAAATAIISVKGVAFYDLEWQPFAFSTRLLAITMQQLASDPAIGTIVLDINSPGGAVTGTKEASNAVYAAAQRKRVISLINPLAASAAYWIASQASEVVAVPSADVGSIGVILLHIDMSTMLREAGVKPTYIYAGEFKKEGNPFEPLTSEAKSYLQGEINTIYADFLRCVARGRSKSVDDVRENFGKGRCMMAHSAKAVGMIDRIETVDRAIQAAPSAAQSKGWPTGRDPASVRRRRAIALSLT